MKTKLLHTVCADDGTVYPAGTEVSLADYADGDDPELALREAEFERGCIDITLPNGEVHTVEPDVVDLIALLIS